MTGKPIELWPIDEGMATGRGLSFIALKVALNDEGGEGGRGMGESRAMWLWVRACRIGT